MKHLPLRYLTIFIILLFSSGINEDPLTIGYTTIGNISFGKNSENESSEKNCLNLGLRKNESKPLNYGEKVETTVIPSPISDYSKAKNISLYNLQNISFSKKGYSFISHSNLFISTTFHRSPFVNILRI